MFELKKYIFDIFEVALADRNDIDCGLSLKTNCDENGIEIEFHLGEVFSELDHRYMKKQSMNNKYFLTLYFMFGEATSRLLYCYVNVLLLANVYQVS